MQRAIINLLLTVFGLGHGKYGPGTLGSLPPVAMVLLLLAAATPAWMIDLTLVLICLLFSIACVRFGVYAEARFGRKDPSQVVADEVAGQAIALLFLPWREVGQAGAWSWNITLALLAFALFRLFDITKLPPANQSQRLPGGWGVLVDDLIAGVYALICVHLLAAFILPMWW